MKPEEQRIAIAEACGWNPSLVSRGKWCHDSNMSMAKNGAYSVWIGRDSLPDYLNDLNAMSGAELWLRKEGRWPGYVGHLKTVCGGGVALCIFATAAQRAEAFLKTLNLWTDS